MYTVYWWKISISCWTSKGKLAYVVASHPLMSDALLPKKDVLISDRDWDMPFLSETFNHYPQPPPPPSPTPPLGQEQLENCDKQANKLLNPSDANFKAADNKNWVAGICPPLWRGGGRVVDEDWNVLICSIAYRCQINIYCFIFFETTIFVQRLVEIPDELCDIFQTRYLTMQSYRMLLGR